MLASNPLTQVKIARETLKLSDLLSAKQLKMQLKEKTFENRRLISDIKKKLKIKSGLLSKFLLHLADRAITSGEMKSH